MKIFLKKYSLSSQNEYDNFKKYQENLIDILKESYEQDFFGENEFEKKIETRKINIVLAFTEENNKLVGTLIYKNTGKGSAIAVLKEYRKYNIGTLLLEYVKNNVHYFYAEINSQNIFMQKFLIINGFNFVKNTNTIKRNLESEKDKIKFLFENEVIYYYHIKFKRSIDKVRTFVMLEYSKK